MKCLDCDRKAWARGLCERDYRMRKTRGTLPPATHTDAPSEARGGHGRRAAKQPWPYTPTRKYARAPPGHAFTWRCACGRTAKTRWVLERVAQEKLDEHLDRGLTNECKWGEIVLVDKEGNTVEIDAQG